MCMHDALVIKPRASSSPADRTCLFSFQKSGQYFLVHTYFGVYMNTVQIQRVSGFPLEDMYTAYGICLERRRIPRNERRLFHGASAAAVHNILQQGFRIVFNRCLCVSGVRVCVPACNYMSVACFQSLHSTSTVGVCAQARCT
jgi:hypothetical protein